MKLDSKIVMGGAAALFAAGWAIALITFACDTVSDKAQAVAAIIGALTAVIGLPLIINQLNQATHAAHVQLKPWLDFEILPTAMTIRQNKLMVETTIEVKNHGRSQAQNIGVYVDLLLEHAGVHPDIANFYRSKDAFVPDGYTLLPEGKLRIVFKNAIDLTGQTEIFPIVAVAVAYGRGDIKAHHCEGNQSSATFDTRNAGKGF
jgi:hypothetical protein